MLISINHQKGGTGKSTLCFNLAIELSKLKGFTVEIVDLDVQQTLTLNSYLRKDHGLSLLNTRRFNNVEDLTRYIETDNDSKIIIVDNGGFDSGLSRISALAADYILTPVSDSIVELQGLKTYEKVLEELSENAEDPIIANVILNNIDPRRKNFEDLKEFINKSKYFKALDTIVRRRSDFRDSISAGKSAIEYNKKSKAAGELKALIKEIKSGLGL